MSMQSKSTTHGAGILAKVAAKVAIEKQDPARTGKIYNAHDDWHWNDH